MSYIIVSHLHLYSRVSNRRDSPLINYSVFCHPPQPYSFATLPNLIQHSRLLILEKFASFQFPILFQTPHLLIHVHSQQRSAIDSITQNKESKIAYDYVMILRNNKFEHIVYYFKKIYYLKLQRGKKFENNNEQKRDFDKKLLHENIK